MPGGSPRAGNEATSAGEIRRAKLSERRVAGAIDAAPADEGSAAAAIDTQARDAAIATGEVRLRARHLERGVGDPAAHTRRGERVYLYTGTWSDLMLPPKLVDRPAVERFADDLAANQVKRIQRPTYAEVTAEGPKLWKWTDAGPVAVEAITDE